MRNKCIAAVSIFPGMASMYSSDWSWGWENRFYSIGDFGGMKEKNFLVGSRRRGRRRRRRRRRRSVLGSVVGGIKYSLVRSQRATAHNFTECE